MIKTICQVLIHHVCFVQNLDAVFVTGYCVKGDGCFVFFITQVHTDGSSQLDQAFQNNPSSLGMRIATGLSAIYLPPLPPPTTASPPKIPQRARLFPRPQAPNKTKNHRPMRTSLK